MWTLDRCDRLRELAARADRRSGLLRRELSDATRGSAERRRLARRIALVEDRRDRLRALARLARP